MDRRLEHLIDEYIGSVRMAVALLEEAGIPRPASGYAWAHNGISVRLGSSVQELDGPQIRVSLR